MSAELSTLLSTPYAAGFIYLHHPHTPTSASIPRPSPSASLVQAQISAIEYNNAKLLYSGILHRMAASTGTEWTGGEVRTWDGFSRGLRSLKAGTAGQASASGGSTGREKGAKTVKGSRKGKEKEVVNEDKEDGSEGIKEELNWVVLITHAERLPRILGSQWAVITRLSELVSIPITLVLVSQIPWDAVRPPSADSPEPIHIYIPAPTRIEVLSLLSQSSTHPLWPHFLNLFVATFYPLTHVVQELAYLASPLWILYTAGLGPHAESSLLGTAQSHSNEDGNGDVDMIDEGDRPRPLEITVKLLTDLKFALSLPLTLAIEHLLPRHISPSEFVHFLTPQSAGPSLSLAPKPKKGIPKLPEMPIPLVGRFLIVAGYLAGQNPTKSDLRLFGRGLGVDGKRKRGGGTRRAGYGRVKVGKVPQRLLGPKPFPLDRLLAIFSSLYSEHAERPPDLMPGIDEGDDYDDDGNDSSSSSSSGSSSSSDSRSPSPSKKKRKRTNGSAIGDSMLDRQRKRVERKRRRDIVREERWEEEVEGICMSTKLWSLIPELEAQGLFKRISPPDRLDNIMLRCEVDYEAAKVLGRGLKMTLDEYLYEAQA